jgi:RimJ/RimL family protein N-acetyltransferase
MQPAVVKPTNGNGRLPDVTIESVARGFFREAERYGFDQADYLRFMSSLLDLANEELTRRLPGRPSVTGKAPATASAIGAPDISDDRVAIRAFDRAQDLAVLRRWVAEPQGRQFLLARTLARPLALEEMIDDPTSVVGMITLADGVASGAMAVLDVNREQRKAELRKLIGEPGMRGQGYGKAATRLWLRYGLETLNLHKIYLSTLDTNLRNIRLNEHLGFKLEGILHDEVLIDGEYHDVLRMAIWDTLR